MRIETILGPGEFEGLARRDLSGTTSVVFDILRATTSMTTALARGARAVRPVREISEALAWRERDPRVLLAGERQGLRIRAAQTGSIDFDLGNSPREFTAEVVAGRDLVMTTTNGTLALTSCAQSGRVLPASFLNLEATLAHLAGRRPAHLLLVCAGTFEEPAYEDILAAGAVCDWWLRRNEGVELADSSAAAWQTFQGCQGDLPGAMRHSKNGRRLLGLPELAEDVAICLRRDTLGVVTEMRAGLVEVIFREAGG